MERVLRRRRHIWGSEAGVSLVETMASVTVLAVVALGLTHTMISGYRSLRTTKTVQQATGVGNEVIEAARGAGYDALAMVTSDLAGDPSITTTCGALGTDYFVDPDGTGPLACEQLVHSAAGGAISDHAYDTTVGSERYSVSQYVTWVDSDSQGGAGQDMKRVVAIVTWTQDGLTKTYRASTLLNGTAHGMPLVDFELTPGDQNLTVAAGESVLFAHTLKNLGIPETFDLSLPNPAGQTWAKTFYRDVNTNGIYDAGTDTALIDTNGNGSVDTGSLATDASINILEVWTISSTATSAVHTMSLTATAASDTTVTRSANLELTVTATPPGLTLYLHNSDDPPTANTTATKAMPMDTEPPTATTLYKYSTDVYDHVARVTAETVGSATEPDARDMANWVWQAPTQIVLEGTMTIHLSAKILPETGKANCNQGDWDIYVRKKSTSSTDTGTLIASATKQKDRGCSIFTDDDTLTIPRTTLLANEWLEVKIMADKTKGPGMAWYYDTTTYDSYVEFPQVVVRA